MKRVLDYLKSKIKPEDTVILACSTGADSMCLLSLLKMTDAKIICAHVNHNVRKESEEEYTYLEKYCKDNNLVFEGIVLNDLPKSNFEATARKKRYEFLESLYEKYQAKYILTAHHGDDLIETILMRITRGSNLSGYLGIKKEDGKYLRPLLEVTKEEILQYMKENKLKYFHDYTNDEDDHTRNRYRHKILPVLKEEYPEIHEKYLEFSKELQDYDNFLKTYLESLNLIQGTSVNIPKFLKQDVFVQKKIIEALIKNIQKTDELEVSKQTVRDILNLANTKQSNAMINLKNNYIAKKSYDKLIIEKIKENEPYFIEFSQEFQNNMFIIMLTEETKLNINYIIRLDSKELKLPLYVRSRKEKDVMEVKNLGHKKVKDIFIDSKIPLDERNCWPILVDSANNILWIPGIKKSKFAKDKKEKYDIILSSERKQLDE